MSEYSFPVTVFTPTYNRSYIIDNLYKSLCRQTCLDFEWLVIVQGDDGTVEKIVAYKQEGVLKNINCIFNTERKGINRAMNDALSMAKGELFFKVDDDDVLCENAIELIIQWSRQIKKNNNGESFAGVSGLRAHNDGRIIGGDWILNTDYVDATGFERKKYSLQGDKAEAYFTDVLRRYAPLPEFDGETLTFESMIYDRVSDAGLKIRWFNKVIYYTEYLPDGCTANTKDRLKDNLNTYGYLINNKIYYKTELLSDVIKNMCRYCEMCREKGMDFHDSGKHFSKARWIFYLGWFSSRFTKYI